VKSYKKQIEEAEEIAALNLAKYRKVAGALGDAEAVADANEQVKRLYFLQCSFSHQLRDMLLQNMCTVKKQLLVTVAVSVFLSFIRNKYFLLFLICYKT
jgi:hypothetical protein